MAMKHYGRVLIQYIYSSIPKLIPFSLHVSHWFDNRLNIQLSTQHVGWSLNLFVQMDQTDTQEKEDFYH